MTQTVEGQKQKCVYCHALRTVAELRKGVVTHAEQGKIVEVYGWYCRDKPCNGRDQMAHEG